MMEYFDLDDNRFDLADLFESGRLIKGFEFHRITFSGQELRDLVFEACTFRNVYFNNCQLTGITLIDCNVIMVILEECTVSNVRTKNVRYLSNTFRQCVLDVYDLPTDVGWPS